MFTAAMRFDVPLDALHSAASSETSSPMVSAPPLLWVIALSWSEISCREVGGSPAVKLSTCWVICVGSAITPTKVTSAISAGNNARNPKKATPAASIDTLSSWLECHARPSTCRHPRTGIWVGEFARLPTSLSVTAQIFPKTAQFMRQTGYLFDVPCAPERRL